MMQAIQQQQLLQAAVAKHMPDLLSILLPGAEDSTVHAALNCLATGLGAFKAEGESEQAVTVLPSIGAFVHHLLPVMNNALTDLPVNSGEATDLSMLCELLTLAIKTFKSAVEVCMRERGPEQDTCAFLSRYVSQLLIQYLT